MKTSLMLYETYYGISKKVSDIFSKIIGNSKVLTISTKVEDISVYDNIFFIFSFHGYETAEKTKEYIKKVRDIIKDKKIILIGVGLYKKDIENYSKSICDILSRKADYMEFIEGELRVNKLTDKDKEVLEKFLTTQNIKLMDMGKFKVKECCDLAAKYREIIYTPSKKADDKIIDESISKFLLAHNTCALATTDGENVRVTPIEYIYYKNSLYFITEGGLKFKGILQNSNISVCIYEEFKGMNNIKGLQITGKASVIDIGNEEYKEVLVKRNLKYENITKIPINMNMVKMEISKYEFLNSEFKSLGYDTNQKLEIKSAD